MASRPIKMPEKEDKEAELPPSSQQKRPETGRHLLQVDRQTKGAYATPEAAEAVGMAIKKAYPVVQVTVYDVVKSTNKIIELP